MQDRGFIALLIIVSVLIGLLLGLSVADTYVWSSKWLKDWQTLIAGIVAIFAAILTVTQMRVDARANEERHNRAITSSRERERHFLVGALTQSKLLSVIAQALEAIEPLQPIDLNADFIIDRGGKCAAIGSRLKTATDAWVFTAARPYMDYQSDASLQHLAVVANCIEDAGHLLGDCVIKFDDPRKAAGLDEALMSHIRITFELCGMLSEALESTLRTYEV